MNGQPIQSKFWKPVQLLGLALLAAFVLAACQPAATPVPTATLAPTPVPTQPPAEVTLKVAEDPNLGKFLVSGDGMTLYMFTKDEPDKSNCEAGCLVAWPPFITQGSPVAGEGVDAGLIGTTRLADGRLIVTYNQMPLYFWASDTKPGDVTGQGVNDVWFVVSPAGEIVGMESAAADVTLSVAEHPNLGKILVDGEGKTLYMFTKDEPDQSNCTEGCLTAWPPFVTEGKPVAGEGVDDALVGMAELADGRKIVTYNRMPLYYWAQDANPGDATGQGVNDVWFVVSPDGKPVGMQAMATDVTVAIAEHPTLGKILVDGEGRTLYIFTNDKPDQSNCEGGCLAAWPPFITEGSPQAGEGVDASLIGFTTLADGRKIVTYNKMPLYYWASDTRPGDATGQGVNGVWFVVNPEDKATSMNNPYDY